MRKFYRGNVKKYCRNSCVISFCASAASYVALKVALTNSSRNVVGFLRLGSRKYTKLHLNALFSVRFTRLASTVLLYSFLPAENGSPLSFARYLFCFSFQPYRLSYFIMFLVTKCGIFLGVFILKELPNYISNFLFYGNSSCAFNIQDAFAAYVHLPSSLSCLLFNSK